MARNDNPGLCQLRTEREIFRYSASKVCAAALADGFFEPDQGVAPAGRSKSAEPRSNSKRQRAFPAPLSAFRRGLEPETQCMVSFSEGNSHAAMELQQGTDFLTETTTRSEGHEKARLETRRLLAAGQLSQPPWLLLWAQVESIRSQFRLREQQRPNVRLRLANRCLPPRRRIFRPADSSSAVPPLPSRQFKNFRRMVHVDLASSKLGKCLATP
ncbi:hypothetical protein EV129_11966 [Rhizobium azibense]|uniref:Uncharacterized protein n=2 Tax=Rhizobium azibense TaxID=1136135 RepID=A0A4R3REJ8_9HYPH|nr:hypothetical protein EV129_11966 [Rhizobium azibense]